MGSHGLSSSVPPTCWGSCAAVCTCLHPPSADSQTGGDRLQPQGSALLREALGKRTPLPLSPANIPLGLGGTC